jgi:hypothetical protein
MGAWELGENRKRTSCETFWNHCLLIDSTISTKFWQYFFFLISQTAWGAITSGVRDRCPLIWSCKGLWWWWWRRNSEISDCITVWQVSTAIMLQTRIQGLSFRFLSGKQAALFMVTAQCVQAQIWISGYDRFLPNPSHFTIHLTILYCIF